MIVGWLWYVGTLVPVIGLVQVGLQSMADRYTYIPAIGLFIVVAWGMNELTEYWKLKKNWVAVFSLAVICALMAVTWKQVSRWKNSATVFKHAFEVTDNNSTAHNNYGLAMALQGKISKGVKHFRLALEIDPHSPEANLNLGIALYKQGSLKP